MCRCLPMLYKTSQATMTLRELIDLAGSRPLVLGGALVVAPLVAFFTGLLHARGKGGLSPWRYLYAVLVYLACIPGCLAAVLTAYALFFTGQNLLDVNVLVYLLPLAGMGLTLLIVRRQAEFDDIPGFDRLSGLMVMLAMTFVIVLAVARTRIWLVFGGSLGTLAAFALGVFALLKWGAHTAFRGRGEAKRARPGFPGA